MAKSGSQRRVEIKAHRSGKRAALLAKQAREQTRARTALLKDKVLVNAAAHAPTGSYDTPDFTTRGYYVDHVFDCKSCGVAQIWTATQQKWWYEVAKGDVWTVAVLCKPCRAKERERKAVARKTSLDGLARKQQRKLEAR